MAKDNTITLYDLQLTSGATISPFVWRTKYALKHKGFEIDIVPGGFTGIKNRTNGFSDRLPTIVDDGHWVKDSWAIAEYLDATYPDRPMLFGDESQKLLTKFIDGWAWSTAIGPWFGCYIKDYHDLSLPIDHEYIRWSREMMMGGYRLKDVQEGREERLPLVPPTLEPLRQLLKEQPWLGGSKPNFADYCVLSSFLWCASVATTPPLTDDDPLRDWLDRGFDLYGGLGRHQGLHTLFGLKLREGDPEPYAKPGAFLGGAGSAAVRARMKAKAAAQAAA
jgi:glutathione S-transferase